jgi:hypothetical protein
MSQKVVKICDECGQEIGDNKGAIVQIKFIDTRSGMRQGDLCGDCARIWSQNLRQMKTRGRPPKSGLRTQVS